MMEALFVPKEVKKYSAEQIKSIESLSGLSYQELAKEIIYPLYR